MSKRLSTGLSRRTFLAGSTALGVLALSGAGRAFAADVDFKIPAPIGDL